MPCDDDRVRANEDETNPFSRSNVYNKAEKNTSGFVTFHDARYACSCHESGFAKHRGPCWRRTRLEWTIIENGRDASSFSGTRFYVDGAGTCACRSTECALVLVRWQIRSVDEWHRIEPWHAPIGLVNPEWFGNAVPSCSCIRQAYDSRSKCFHVAAGLIGLVPNWLHWTGIGTWIW